MKTKKGFTLIELMVVMAIIAVLAALIVGAITVARQTATETTHRSNAKTVQTGLEAAYAKHKSYCGTLTGQMACGTYSFAEAAGDTTQGPATAIANNLNVKLGTASCTVRATNAGGGNVIVGPSSYTITPRNHKCDADLSTSDILKQE